MSRQGPRTCRPPSCVPTRQPSSSRAGRCFCLSRWMTGTRKWKDLQKSAPSLCARPRPGQNQGFRGAYQRSKNSGSGLRLGYCPVRSLGRRDRVRRSAVCPGSDGSFRGTRAISGSHRLHAGTLPSAIGPICKRLEGHDLVITVGAPVFRYYPYVAGDYLPAGTKLLQITDDPDMAAKAPVGDSLVSDSRLFLQAILPQLNQREEKPNPYKRIRRRYPTIRPCR